MARTKKLQIITQIVSLVLFAVLLLTGRIQLWMGLFLVSAVLTLLLGRFYCGWICPINTVMKLVARIKARFELKSFAVPETLKKPAFRYGMLMVFILALVLMIASGKRLPVLPLFLAAGVLLTVFFPESLWHRYLCPYGTVLRLTGAKAGKLLEINTEDCLECGICREVCPGGAITGTGRYSIDKGLCLVCLECADQCPQQAIYYK